MRSMVRRAARIALVPLADVIRKGLCQASTACVSHAFRHHRTVFLFRVHRFLSILVVWSCVHTKFLEIMMTHSGSAVSTSGTRDILALHHDPRWIDIVQNLLQPKTHMPT